MLKRCKHVRVQEVVDVFQTPEQVAVVLVRYAKGLKDALADGNLYAPQEVGQVIRQSGEGLAFLHGEGVVHRDIKPDNLMLTFSGDVVICDFGLAVALPSGGVSCTSVAGTESYHAPEVHLLNIQGPPADVWALGCVGAWLIGVFVSSMDIGALCRTDDGVSTAPGSTTESEPSSPQCLGWDAAVRLALNKALDSMRLSRQLWGGGIELIRHMLEPIADRRIAAHKVAVDQWCSRRAPTAPLSCPS
mmetsp:Transcript_15767/g.40075  ORF Transcript_15767/g.40075 Transcript_15767/m.40075 type:complete len:246 (-) Transcript_15767:232-969(-)